MGGGVEGNGFGEGDNLVDAVGYHLTTDMADWMQRLRERVMEISAEPRLQACETLEMGGDSLGGP